MSQDNIKNYLPFTINTDQESAKQSDKFLSFALNAVNDDTNGSIGSLTFEKSNEIADSLGDFKLIGNIVAGNDIVVFSVNGSISQIGIFNSRNTYTSLITTDCLGFSQCAPIKGLYKIRLGCERIITFYDGVNSDKYLNLDRLSGYYTDAYSTWLNSNTGTPEEYFTATGLYAWDCDTMNLTSTFNLPHITYLGQGTSGELLVGAYSFAIKLLDVNLNTLGYSLVSPTLPVYKDIPSGSWYGIKGDLNTPENIPDIGGVPVVNKSINLGIENISKEVAYFKLIVNRYSGNSGTTKETFELNQTYLSDVTEIEFAGINADTDEQITIDEVVVPKSNYKISKSQEIVDTRLLRGNLKETTYDWGAIQKASNTILTEYTVQSSALAESNITENTKIPTYYFNKRSYMRDEIYAFGIILRFKDGTYSPTFHIPGREEIVAGDLLRDGAISIFVGNSNLHNRNQVPRIGDGDATDEDWDNQLLEVSPEVVPGWFDAKYNVEIRDVRHLGFIVYTDDIGYGIGPNGGGLVPRWKVFNTAIKYPNVTEPYIDRGLMGYHELNTRYPQLKDCDNSFIYPVDPNDSTQTAYIRHHRFPDTTLESHYDYVDDGDPVNNTDESTINHIGVTFNTNDFYATLPADVLSNIEGHIFVRAVRTSNNKTVLDKGISERVYGFDSNGGERYSSNYSYVQSGFVLNNMLSIYTPKGLYRDEYLPGTYLKHERDYEQQERCFATGGGGSKVLLHNDAQYSVLNIANNYKFRKFSEIYSVAPNEIVNIQGNTTNVYQNYYNGHQTYPVYVSFLEDDDELNSSVALDTFKGDYVSIKIERQVYSNVSSLAYTPIHTNIESDVSYDKQFYGGDIFITRSSHYSHNYNPDGITNVFWAAGRPPLRIYSEFHYIESEVNENLSNTGAAICAKSFDGDYYRGVFDVCNRLGFLQTDIINNECYEEFLSYNEDYSAITDDNLFFPLPLTYNLCSDCNGEFPNRIIWSDKAFENEVEEQWKFNNANDFIDIDPSKGEITNLKFNKNQLLVVTNDSLFSMSPNPQVMNTDVSIVEIGTGDFLSIPANQFVNKDFGYAGNQGRFNSINTQFGYCWIDQVDGRVFIYSPQGLQELSLKGNYQWFKENLPSYLLKDVPEYYCNDSISSDEGIGTFMTYDPLFERLILVKKDYEIISTIFRVDELPAVGIPQGPADSVYIIGDGNLYISVDGDGTFVQNTFDNQNAFRNRSWTYTYSFKKQGWESFMSYRPNWAFYNNDTFFTYINTDVNIWKHGKVGSYREFYGETFPFIIEFIFNNLMLSDLHNLFWYSQTQKWDAVNKTFTDNDNVTFNKLMCYTRNQSTGQLSLDYLDKHTNPFGNIGWSNTNKSVIRTDKNFKVSQLRDLATSSPLVTSDWDEIKSYFTGQGYIDKVELTANLDKTITNQHRLRDLKDKYYNIRLTFDDMDELNKIVVDLLSVKTFISSR